MGLEPTDTEIKQKIASVDTGRTGTIEFPEFREMMGAKLRARPEVAMSGATGIAWTRD